jgi:hypothetical protein
VEEGDRADLLGDEGLPHHDLAAAGRHPGQSAVQVVAGVQVDHGAVRAGGERLALDQGAADPALLVGQDRHVDAVHRLLAQLGLENAAVEALGAGQVGDGDLEPVQSVAHGLLSFGIANRRRADPL